MYSSQNSTYNNLPLWYMVVFSDKNNTHFNHLEDPGRSTLHVLNRPMDRPSSPAHMVPATHRPTK